MASGWQRYAHTIVTRLRDFTLTILIIGGAQILVSLLVWPILFRSSPLGFSMALSLVGFASWFIAFAASLGGRRRGMNRTPLPRDLDNSPPGRPVIDQVQTQIQRAGCGHMLLVSSIIPLGLAFVLRLQADLSTGKTWSDIFPSMP